MGLLVTLVLGGFFQTTAYAVPMTSTGTLGPLNVTSGSLVFNTDPGDPVDGGTYFIDGVQQTGTARVVTLPQNSGGIPHDEGGVFVWDFGDITLGSGVTVSVVGPMGLILLASGTANLGATFAISGGRGDDGGFETDPGNMGAGGGGGGGGGGVLSVFASGDLTVAGTIIANGGDGGLSWSYLGSVDSSPLSSPGPSWPLPFSIITGGPGAKPPRPRSSA